jgi:hypothetical protein
MGFKMDRKKYSKPKRDGFAMAIMLCAIILLFLAGLGTLTLGMHSRMLGVRTCSEIAARSAADSGLTKALFEMNQKIQVLPFKDTDLPMVTDEPLPNSEAYYSYEVTKNSGADNIYTIESIGNSGLAQRTVSGTVELKGLFEYAIFVENQITLKNGTTVTAYNMEADDPPLLIGTNSTAAGAITAKTGVTIDGDVVVGVGGDTDKVIDNKAEAAIKGQTYPSLLKNKASNINVPNSLLEMSSGGSITGSKTISSSAKYDSINLTGSGSLINVDGKNVVLYVTGDLRLGNSDQLQIQLDASLTIFLGGNLYIDNSGAINNLTKDPEKLKIYGLDTCTVVDFKNSGTFYGALYTPEADIRLHNGVQMYGAVVGKSFIQDVNANFYYDMLLRKVSADEIGVRFVVKYWHENFNHYRYRYRYSEHFGSGTGGSGSDGSGSGGSGSVK